MSHRPTFHSGYSHEELADEIARLFGVLDNCLASFERMALLADRIEQAVTARDRLKDTHRLLGLVRSAARTMPDLHPVA